MSDPYVGEIRIFAGNYAPENWAMCNGQLLSVQDNQELFSLIGTTYGGDGVQTFAVPDLRGRLPIGMGSFPGTNPPTIYALGQSGGSETVALTPAQLPVHTHTAQAQSTPGTQSAPDGAVWAASSLSQFSTNAATTSLSGSAVAAEGSDQPHNNMMPFFPLTYMIALVGYYPRPT